MLNEEKSNIAERTTIIELEKEVFKLNNELSNLSFIKKNEKEILNQKINEKQKELSKTRVFYKKMNLQ